MIRRLLHPSPQFKTSPTPRPIATRPERAKMATVEEYKEAVHHKHPMDIGERILQENPDRYCER